MTHAPAPGELHVIGAVVTAHDLAPLRDVLQADAGSPDVVDQELAHVDSSGARRDRAPELFLGTGIVKLVGIEGQSSDAAAVLRLPVGGPAAESRIAPTQAAAVFAALARLDDACQLPAA